MRSRWVWGRQRWIRARTASDANGSEARGRSEETAPASIGPLAAPIGAVGRGLRLSEWHGFTAEQQISPGRDVHLLGGDGEAIALATAPLTGAITQAPA